MTVDAAGLRGRGDDEVYALARKDDRILLTCDPDFLDDRRHPPRGHPPVIVFGFGVEVSRDMGLALSVVNEWFSRGPLWMECKVTLYRAGEFSIFGPSHDTGGRHVSRYRRMKTGDYFEWVGK